MPQKTSNKQAEDIQDIVFSPGRIANLATQMVDDRRNHKDNGIRSGIYELDHYMLPMRPGDLVVVQAFTSNYKTGLMDIIARNVAKNIADTSDDSVVVKITWEHSIEEDTLPALASESQVGVSYMAAGDIAEEAWEKIKIAAVKRVSSPIWMVGHSTIESNASRKRRPRLTMTDVANALTFIADEATGHPLKISLVVFDYLQRIRGDRGETMREKFIDIVDRVKDAGIAFGCPVMLGVQAKREVEERKWKLPKLTDGQETSNIEQSSDKFISLWRPVTSEPLGSTLRVNEHEYDVTPALLVLGLLKNKLGPAPILLPFETQPDFGRLKCLQRI